MTGFSSLILQRQSVRRYDSKAVPKEVIIRCIEAARLSPSASNGQPWSFVVVNEPDLVLQVANATFDKYIPFNKFVPQAPVIVAMVVEKTKVITRLGGLIKHRDFPWMDHGIAAAHFCLQAAELGLGTCMLGWFNEKRVKTLIGIPRKKKLSLLISVGYPPEDYPVREKIRKPLEKILFYDRYATSGSK
jgi:nitroreductase